MSSVFNMSPEEKQKILDSHKTAIKNDSDKKVDTKEGLKVPEKKEENKKGS